MFPSQLVRAEGFVQGNSYRQPTTTKAQARFAPTFRHAKVNVMGITPQLAVKWVPILGIWGIGIAGIGTLFLSDIPKFKQDVLFKIPLVRNYFEDKTPASDRPF